MGNPEGGSITEDIEIRMKQVSSLAASLGNLEGVRLPGFLSEKETYIWVPLLEPEDIKSISLGAICNFGKRTS